MFAALGRWVKATMYLLTGRIDAARKTLDSNPYVMQAKYEEVIKEKTSQIHQYRDALAGMIAQQEQKMTKIERLTADVERLEKLKEGALAKAKARVAELGTQDKAAIQNDEDYRKCLTAFNDFSSTLQEKLDHIQDLEGDVEEYNKRIGDHKISLQHMQRSLEGVKSEAKDAVAEVISANHEKELADMLSGISDDKTNKKLSDLRTARSEAKAEARISKELAGTDGQAQEAEFLEFARTSSSNSEFEALVGLAGDSDAGTSASPATTEKLPE